VDAAVAFLKRYPDISARKAATIYNVNSKASIRTNKAPGDIRAG
jgi:hypothetical protein